MTISIFYGMVILFLSAVQAKVYISPLIVNVITNIEKCAQTVGIKFKCYTLPSYFNYLFC
jgi:hypothetical protein